MNSQLLLLPILVQVLLTLSVYGALAVAKGRALARGEVDLTRRAMHADAWPERVQQINNNIRNQFEVPILFYVVTLTLWALHETGLAAHALAWLFVGSRVAHMLIHTGSNHVPTRRRIFTIGCVAVASMALLAGWSVCSA
jgi:hypothetical protein